LSDVAPSGRLDANGWLAETEGPVDETKVPHRG